MPSRALMKIMSTPTMVFMATLVLMLANKSNSKINYNYRRM